MGREIGMVPPIGIGMEIGEVGIGMELPTKKETGIGGRNGKGLPTEKGIRICEVAIGMQPCGWIIRIFVASSLGRDTKFYWSNSSYGAC